MIGDNSSVKKPQIGETSLISKSVYRHHFVDRLNLGERGIGIDLIKETRLKGVSLSVVSRE